MKRKMADQVVEEFKKQNGPRISILEAIAMTKVMTDDYEVYAIQKGDVTFLVWKDSEGGITAKTQCW